MSRKYLLLGISNPYSDRRQDALSPEFPGSAGARLFEIAGVQLDEYERAFVRDNVFLHGDDARCLASRIRKTVRVVRRHSRGVEELRVVALGRLVGTALGRAEAPWLAWKEIYMPTVTVWGTTVHVAVMPHPSGLNRWYNDPSNVERARGFMRRNVRYALKESQG